MRLWILLSMALSGLLSVPAQASDPFIGEIKSFASNFCPKGFAPLLGQELKIAQNQALFALLGVTYGGDGTMTFKLPDVEPVAIDGGATYIQCIAIFGQFPSRN